MPIPPIFDACCGPDIFRYSLDRPWVAHGRLWATDAVVLVWTSLDNLDLAEDEMAWFSPDSRKLPDVLATANEFKYQFDLIPLPDGVSVMRPCNKCGGMGHVGVHQDILITCPWCDGGGMLENMTRVRVGPIDLMARYVALLREHGVAAVRLAIPPGQNQPTPNPVRFDGDGFSGILQPMELRELFDDD